MEDGRAVALRGLADHPTTKGQLCPKVNRFLDRVHHPDRILTPLRRTGPKGSGEFTPITWDDAIAEIGKRFRSIIAHSGPAAILPYSFDGTQGVIQKGILARRFFAALGTSDVRRHLCGVTAWLGAADVLGTPRGIDPEDLHLARTVILWGTNTFVTNRHLWATIEQAREAGAEVIVVDPVRTATAERADRFLQLRPGSDVALVAGLIHVMDRDGLLDPTWLAEHTTDAAGLLASVIDATPLTTEARTGIPADEVVAVAHRFATVRPAAVRSLVGPEHRGNGREIMRAIAMLPTVTGAWRDAGGGLARSTQVWWEEAFGLDTEEARLAPPARSFNMARLGEVLTDPTIDPPIEALFVHNSNPAVIAPDQNRIIEGLRRENLFTVVAEQFLTDTARHADLVLPATTQIEHLDLAPAWGHLNVALNRPAIAPMGEAKPNNEIFRLLATELGLDAPEHHESDEDLIRGLLENEHPMLDGITWERLVDDGWARFAIDPGTRPHADTTFTLGPLDIDIAEPEAPFQLISLKQHVGFLNANYAQFPAHLPTPPHPRLEVHPIDASALGVTDGARVRVHNERGSLTVEATVSDRVQPGLVALPFGWGHSSTPEGRAVNALTNPAVPDDDTGSAAFHDTWVHIEVV